MKNKTDIIEYIQQLISDGSFNKYFNWNYVPQKISSINSFYRKVDFNAGEAVEDVYSSYKLYFCDVSFMPLVPNPPVVETNYYLQATFNSGGTVLCDWVAPICYFSAMNTAEVVTVKPEFKDMLFTSVSLGGMQGQVIFRGWLITFE